MIPSYCKQNSFLGKDSCCEVYIDEIYNQIYNKKLGCSTSKEDNWIRSLIAEINSLQQSSSSKWGLNRNETPEREE